jgi:predicted metal-dependent enzyme (double-stranded beta helix superfamily)
VPEKLYLDRSQLIERTRFHAAEVTDGVYPFVDFDPDVRWHRRIYRDRRLDIWIISWLPGQGTQLHDHGGSSGSFTVVSGTLAEAVVAGSGSDHTVDDHDRAAGDTSAFDAHYVHDVRNLGDGPAVSVHAYSPPLTTMTFYDLSDGRLDAVSSLATEDPEPTYDIVRAS